jgi:hypothetical protein
MALYSIARTGTVTTSGSATFDVGNSTGTRPRLMEIGVFIGAATASTFGVNRPTTLGTRTSPVALLPEDPADPTLTGITLVDSAIAWSAQPTMGAADFRLIGLPATIGVGIIWTFPRGLVIAVSLPIVIVNRATNSAVNNCYAVADT